jgi:hypothetical protein
MAYVDLEKQKEDYTPRKKERKETPKAWIMRSAFNLLTHTFLCEAGCG